MNGGKFYQCVEANDMTEQEIRDFLTTKLKAEEERFAECTGDEVVVEYLKKVRQAMSWLEVVTVVTVCGPESSYT